MDNQTLLLLIASGGAVIAVFVVGLIFFSRWAKRESENRRPPLP